LKVKVLSEHGYEESALGFSLSYNSTVERAKELFSKFAWGKSGETKFLESMYIWVDVDAPRFWWSEADTYRISTKQSASTMHTLAKNFVKSEDFEYPIMPRTLIDVNHLIDDFTKKRITIAELKNGLPDGFLQRRIWVINYRTLQNIYAQRHNHRLPQWHTFLDTVLSQIQHPEFIKPPE